MEDYYTIRDKEVTKHFFIYILFLKLKCVLVRGIIIVILTTSKLDKSNMKRTLCRKGALVYGVYSYILETVGHLSGGVARDETNISASGIKVRAKP